ncbi:JmjC domain-containing protein [Streptomyces phaeochromogenes]|uniref:JmjC domain-containing protein n=1 Tax=Streptomyces phaeochromogenes TaxID=1923 RepID=UPI003698223E
MPLGDERAAGQTVSLADEEGFERGTRAAQLARAYAERPRTRVYESLNVRSDDWFSLVALHLVGLLRRDVVCTAYESCTGDSNLGAHFDQWLGVIVQMRGAKQWRLWPAEGCLSDTLVTEAGDVLVLPERVTHAVSTPARPGHSVHLVFAVTGKSIETWSDDHSGATDSPRKREVEAAL